MSALRPSFLLVGLLVLLAACRGPVEVRDGREAFTYKRYDRATELLARDYGRTDDAVERHELAVLLARSYSRMNEPEAAVTWYERALDDLYTDDAQRGYALALMRAERYDDARRAWSLYGERSYDRLTVSRYLPLVDEALAADSAPPPNIRLEPAGDLNTAGNDYAPSRHPDGRFFFASDGRTTTGDATSPWSGRPAGDIFQAGRQGEGFTPPTQAPEAWITAANEGPVSISPDGQTAVFTRCGISDEEDLACGLWVSDRFGDTWGEPRPLDIVPDSINAGHATFSASGDTLFFSSDLRAGFGGNDIYFTVRTDTAWSYPRNAGNAINGPEDELFPTVGTGGTIYFSSRSHAGYGGLDIFRVTRSGRGWTAPENMGYGINSGADDMHYLVIRPFTPDARDGILEEVILSSTRTGGRGGDDIWRYRRIFYNEFVLELVVRTADHADTTDAESPVRGMKPLRGAFVEVTPMKDRGGPTTDGTTDADGRLTTPLVDNADHRVFVEKDGFFNRSITVTTRGRRAPTRTLIVVRDTVDLERIFPEKEIVIDNIYYDYDKATLRPESLPVLDTLVSFFEENSDLVIEIGSHTDSRGSDAYNERLSQARAQSVVDYLVDTGGVPREQLRAKGYGETRLVNRCSNGVDCTEEEHQENRRTTFRVLFDDGSVLDSAPD